MIASPKSSKNTQMEGLSHISFLKMDGYSSIEDPEITSNMYVSKEDHNKYGKVETYWDGNIPTRTKYYLKQFRGGRPGELLVDPWGMMAKAEDLSAYVTQRGSRFCEYVEVPQMIYDSYVLYLRTRDSRYFRTCEKFLLDKVL